jgi:hypothetical protein
MEMEEPCLVMEYGWKPKRCGFNIGKKIWVFLKEKQWQRWAMFCSVLTSKKSIAFWVFRNAFKIKAIVKTALTNFSKNSFNNPYNPYLLYDNYQFFIIFMLIIINQNILLTAVSKGKEAIYCCASLFSIDLSCKLLLDAIFSLRSLCWLCKFDLICEISLSWLYISKRLLWAQWSNLSWTISIFWFNSRFLESVRSNFCQNSSRLPLL